MTRYTRLSPSRFYLLKKSHFTAQAHDPWTRNQDTKPWQDAYNIELTTALSLGMDAHEKLKLSLDDQYFIIFENADKARLIP